MTSISFHGYLDELYKMFVFCSSRIFYIERMIVTFVILHTQSTTFRDLNATLSLDTKKRNRRQLTLKKLERILFQNLKILFFVQILETSLC